MIRFRTILKIFHNVPYRLRKPKKKKKTNGVQFRHRMTKNKHKQNKVPKLPFWKTEPNELADSVSQPVQLVERDSQNFLKPSSDSQESKITNGVQIQLRITENRYKWRQRPKLLFQQTEFSELDDLVSQQIQPIERDHVSTSSNLSELLFKTRETTPLWI